MIEQNTVVLMLCVQRQEMAWLGLQRSFALKWKCKDTFSVHVSKVFSYPTRMDKSGNCFIKNTPVTMLQHQPKLTTDRAGHIP